jgi:hypothetical protein
VHVDYVRSLGYSGLRKLTVLDEVPSIIEFAMVLENSDGIIVSEGPIYESKIALNPRYEGIIHEIKSL